MTTNNERKIQKLLDMHQPQTVLTAQWLEQNGISHDLQKHYRKSGWLESIGTGAFRRPNDQVGWEGGLFAIQTQIKLPVHAGALTALSLQGYAHYLRLGAETVFLFSPPKTNLPAWFRNHDWGRRVHHCKTSILPPALALTDQGAGNFSIQISTPERAILECLYLAPASVDLVECYQIMEGLTNLRPKLLQPLLEQCSSIKVKRLFLYMADKAGHSWNKRLDTAALDLGSGARTITSGGVYVSRFALTIPEELAKL
ncbi:MAG: hypothetical protein EOM20_19715 [Spartobacteria bacterium]|nr:hypothetical protein [Spartobacteria bacterium]